MARAAVKAKQQERAKAQPAKAAHSRGRRGHAAGGNPNQQLFFMRLRRRQKWVYLALAVVFAATFAGVGVGSGTGGLSDLYSGLFGGGGNSVSKAQAEVAKDPVKGYRDLATAYEGQGNNAAAITALQSYLQLKKKDALVWSELGGLQLSQGQSYATQYQQAAQTAQASDPGQSFTPGGALGQALGTNPLSQTSSQQATSQATQLYEQATGAYAAALKAYRTAARLQPHNADAQFQIATAAESAGQYPVAVRALKQFLRLDPHSAQKAQVEQAIKQLTKAQAKK